MQIVGMRKVIWLSAIFFLGLSACEKPEDKKVGLSTQPEEDELGLQIDTTTIITRTTFQDSLRSDELSSSLVGNMNDPVFGETRAGFFTQLLLPTSNVQFNNPENHRIDSVVLALEYSGFYGHKTTQTFIISEATQDYYLDSSYYTNDEVVHTGINIIEDSAEAVTPDPESTVVLNNDTVPAQIRFKLTHDFAKAIFDPGNQASLANNTTFLDFFKGLYIQSTSDFAPNQGGLLYVNLTSANSKYTIYYTDTTNGNTSPSTFNLIMGASATRFTTFEHDYTQNIIDQANDTVTPKNPFFVQSTAGTNGIITFPNIKDYAAADIAITKASLTLAIQPGTNADPYDAHEILLLFGIRQDGSVELIPDQFEGVAHIDGTLNEIDNTYNFTITRFIQELITTDRYKGLRVTSSGGSVSGNRVVLNGGFGSSENAKLVLTYVTL